MSGGSGRRLRAAHRQTVEVTAGVIVHGSRLLACQRPPGGWHPLKWEFPGGKLEAGETLVEGLRRELREELGIEAAAGALLWRTRHQYPGRSPFTLHFFAVSRYAGRLTNKIFAAMRWVHPAEIRTVDFLDGDREFVERIAAGSISVAETVREDC